MATSSVLFLTGIAVSVFLHIDVADATRASPTKFLIVSAPREGKVAYKRIGPGGSMSTEPMQTLISGLVHPQGLAVDQKSGKLLVADPDSKKVLAYKLRAADDSLTATAVGSAMNDVEARWVAIDGLGNAYATDEPKNRILKVSAAQLRKGEAAPHVLYEALSLASVSGPGGIAVDNFFTYWVNKQVGTQTGSLVKAPSTPDSQNPTASVLEMAHNTEKSYGLCSALNNVFYTQPEGTMFAMKKSGSEAQLVSNKLSKPRGCAWDGDGTVFVADRGSNAVYSFASNMPELGPTLLQKAVDFEDAFGVAVFAGASARGTGCGMILALMLALLGSRQ